MSEPKIKKPAPPKLTLRQVARIRNKTAKEIAAMLEADADTYDGFDEVKFGLRKAAQIVRDWAKRPEDSI